MHLTRRLVFTAGIYFGIYAVFITEPTLSIYFHIYLMARRSYCFIFIANLLRTEAEAPRHRHGLI